VVLSVTPVEVSIVVLSVTPVEVSIVVLSVTLVEVSIVVITRHQFLRGGNNGCSSGDSGRSSYRGSGGSPGDDCLR